MEGYTAEWYASLTRKSIDEFKALAQRVADQLAPGGHVLVRPHLFVPSDYCVRPNETLEPRRRRWIASIE